MVIFFSSVHLVYFNQLFCFSASKLFLILDQPNHILKKYTL